MSNTELLNVTADTTTAIYTDGMLESGSTSNELVICDYWDAADYMMLTPYRVTPSVAMNVVVTGRKVRYDAPKLSGTPVVRISITLVNDGPGWGEECEPNEVIGGWLVVK